MNANIRIIFSLCGILSSVLIQAKVHPLSVRNDTGWNLRINYVLYLPQWKKTYVRLIPHAATVLGDASQLKITSVSAAKGLRNFMRPTPALDIRSLAKALKDAREFRTQKRGTTIVFYLNPNKTKIYSIAEPEFTRSGKMEMKAFAVKKLKQ